jgi:hypothetical protein
LAALLGGARSRRDEYIMINPLLSSPSMPSIWTRVVCEGLAPLYTHTKNSSLRFVSSPTSPLMPYFLPLVRPVCVCLSTRDIPPPPPGCFGHGYIPTVLGFKITLWTTLLTIHPTLLSGCLHRLLARVILELGALCPCPVPSVLPVVAPS